MSRWPDKPLHQWKKDELVSLAHAFESVLEEIGEHADSQMMDYIRTVTEDWGLERYIIEPITVYVRASMQPKEKLKDIEEKFRGALNELLNSLEADGAIIDGWTVDSVDVYQ